MPRSKSKTVKAWAVVCSNGASHDMEWTKRDAAIALCHYDGTGSLDWMSCSPHTVVPLTGEWTPPVKLREKDRLREVPMPLQLAKLQRKPRKVGR